MDDQYNLLLTRYDELKHTVDEIRTTQNKIASALLGSFEQNVPGLIEETRSLKRQVDLLSTQVNNNSNQLSASDKQINELVGFKQDTKKIVLIIATAIPFVFELGKGIFYFVWEYFKAPIKH